MQSPDVKKKLSRQTPVSHPPPCNDNCHSASEPVHKGESFNDRLQRLHSSCDYRRTKHRHKSSEPLVSDHAATLFDPASHLAGSIGFFIVLSMVARKLFNNLETQIISVWLVDDNLGRNTKCFPDDILRVVVWCKMLWTSATSKLLSGNGRWWASPTRNCTGRFSLFVFATAMA